MTSLAKRPPAKYSPPTESILIEGGRGDGFIEVSIVDNGIGIPPDEREHVFEQFYRARNTAAVEGTGLGLTLCRQIVQSHRGKIWISENYPSGTRITVRLPTVSE
jgi:signal transduction histidine kinase